MRSFGVFLVPILSLAGSICPIYHCDSALSANTCAVSASPTDYSVSLKGCDSGFMCSAVAVANWAETRYVQGERSTGEVNCQEETLGTEAEGSFQSLPCVEKEQGKTFKSGQTVIPCQSSDDCLLTDGSKTTCMCGFREDGFGICSAAYSNEDVFEGYWRECGTENAITEEETALYWTAYMENWIYIQSPLPCMDIFWEIKLVKSLYQDYSNAFMTILALFYMVF